MSLKTVLLGGAALTLIGCSSAEHIQESSVTEDAVANVATTQSEESPTSKKIVVESEADLPRHEFVFTKKPSELVFDGGPELDALVDQLDVALTDIFENYDILDDGAKYDLLLQKGSVLFEREDWEEYLTLTPKLLETTTKPMQREMNGFLFDPYARAAFSVSTTEGDAFSDAFRANLITQISTIDVDIARSELQSMQATMQVISASLIEASIKGSSDPALEQAGNVGGRDTVSSILDVRITLNLLPHASMIAEVIAARLAEVPEQESADLWTLREAEVTEGSEVIVAVWDTGVDSELQGDRMWVNPSSEGPGYAHGIAFGPDFELQPADLLVEAGEYSDQIDDLIDIVKGSLDLQAGIESDEKTTFLQAIQSLTPETMMDFQKALSVTTNFIHGQHVADIAVVGNDVAKILNVRFTWPSDPLPTEPMDEAYVERLVAAAQTSVDFLKANDVKVVNLSWRITRPMIEGMLQITGAEPEANARQERAAAIFETLESGLIEVFASAPEILFVAGAGNEDENIEFTTSVPAGINLPNLITVGAVDRELQPAGFTSYGESIDVYANGFEISGRVPGGRELALSGTSMAAPQVANLAAKLWATDPGLSVEEVIAIMIETSTAEGEGELPVVHPANALASIR